MPSPSHRVLSLRCILGLPYLSSCHFCICVYTLNCFLQAETKKMHFFHLPLWIFSLALRHRSTAAFSCFDRQSPLNWVTFRLNLICQKSYCRITALNIYQFSQTAGRSISLPTVSGQSWYNRIHSVISLLCRLVPTGLGSELLFAGRSSLAARKKAI